MMGSRAGVESARLFLQDEPVKTCDHGSVDLEVRQGRWWCMKCARDVEEERGSKGVGMGTMMLKHDPYEYPSEQGVWHKGRCGITPDEVRAIQRQNAALKENARESKQGGRLRARIPAALFWAQRRADPHYWDNKKNLDRVAKDWGISR
jgi:hypothetical protein